jgi:hypothetical protein|tara:strand:+ start:699 stop:1187 length:489 start_codon:yes stop_codon:yes gene_type:complete
MNANGRVNILNHVNNAVFQLYDKIPIDEKVTSYRKALTGNIEANTLSKTFFSAGNILILQHAIMAGVYKSSNGRFQIGYQNEDTLKIVMRSIFLQHASNLPQNITAQVEALNKLVTDYCIPQICGEAEGYIKYKNDVSTLPTPLSHGVSTYSNNILEMKKFF